MHPNAERVRAALVAAGCDAEIVVLPGGARTAAQAAASLGVEPGRIANSLVFAAAGEPILVLASGAHRVDLGKLAAVLGVAVDRADPDTVRAATGFAIGGVAPVGFPQPLRAVVDRDLFRYDEVWAAAGTPDTVFRTTPAELARLTGGEVADLA